MNVARAWAAAGLAAPAAEREPAVLGTSTEHLPVGQVDQHALPFARVPREETGK